MAFPVTGILDDFNRANAGSLGSNWTTNIDGTAPSGHQIVSNQAVPLGNFASSYWSAATFGPDCESRITIATKPTTGFNVAVYGRLQSPGSAAADGYVAATTVLAGTDDLTLQRVDNGAYTQLGASVLEERTNGDVLGLECIGTTLTVYIGATSKMTRTDSTYAGVGYIGFEGDQASTGRYDDFGGGTIGTTPVSLAGTITPDLTFAGNLTVTSATALVGTITPGLTFAGVAENVPMELAALVTADLVFAGDATTGGAPPATSLAGQITPALTFAGDLIDDTLIYVLSGATVELTAAGFAPGLLGTIGVRIETSAGVVVQARSTAGIIEEPGAPGTYTATRTAPGPLGSYRAIWDDAALTGASEYLMVVAVLPSTDPYQVLASYPATLRADGFSPGLTGTIGIRINDGQGATVIARATAGITEIPGSPGSYEATLTAPSVLGSYVAIWDDATGGTAAETFLVLFAGVPAPPAPPRYSAGPLPWMVFGGVEIGNAARTLAYLGNRYDPMSNPAGLADISGAWRVGQAGCCLCPVLGTDGAGIDVGFTRPDDLGASLGDPAPWYDPGVPESAQFLGVLITQITGLDSTVSRSKVERAAGLGGAALGVQRAAGREIGVRAVLVATSCPGLDYGRRWLSHALANDLCDDCESYQLELRTTCPPDDSPDVGLVNLYEVGLSEGPRVIRDSGLPDCCDLLEVEWTLTAGNPLMYACPVVVVPRTTPSGVATISGTIDPPEPFGTIAAQIEVDTGTVAGVGILIRAWDQLLADPCPGADGEECLSIRLSGLPEGVRVRLDGARQRLSVTDSAGVETDGLPYVVMSDGQSFDWPEFVGCQRVCVAVSVYVEPGSASPAGSTVAISSQHRFLA